MLFFYRSCFEWESTFQSFVALVFWLIICYYFEPWMLPIAGLLIFLKQYVVRKLTQPETVPWDEVADSDLDEDDDEDKDKVPKDIIILFIVLFGRLLIDLLKL